MRCDGSGCSTKLQRHNGFYFYDTIKTMWLKNLTVIFYRIYARQIFLQPAFRKSRHHTISIKSGEIRVNTWITKLALQFLAALLLTSSANAMSTEECKLLSSDSATIMRNFHSRVLDGKEAPSIAELRPSLTSTVMKSDDGIFWFIVEVTTGQYIEEFGAMSESDREENRAYIAVQILAKCLDGTVEKYSMN